jgi:hypothetical protein
MKLLHLSVFGNLRPPSYFQGLHQHVVTAHPFEILTFLRSLFKKSVRWNRREGLPGILQADNGEVGQVV